MSVVPKETTIFPCCIKEVFSKVNVSFTTQIVFIYMIQALFKLSENTGNLKTMTCLKSYTLRCFFNSPCDLLIWGSGFYQANHQP